jgi:hypothetical protein
LNIELRQSSLFENDKGTLSESGAETGNRGLESKFKFPDINVVGTNTSGLESLALSPSEISLNNHGMLSVLNKPEEK